MVKIETKIDHDLVNQRIQNGREVLFEVAWENNGLYYPMNPWQDFGLVILGWWSTAISSLANGEQDKVKLSFMDGTYALFLTINRQTKSVTILSEDGKFEAQSSIDEIKEQMVAAVNSIRQEVLTLNNAETQRRHLDECLKLIG
jgi:hypothetical protein